MVTLRINGREHQLDGLDPEMPLLWALRDHLGLTGTRFGCGKGQCGACTIHVDGKATRACMYPIGSLGERTVTTIEGLASQADQALQDAWVEHQVPQCGYCQAGQIMTAAELLANNPTPDDEAIDTAMSGNLCRCGTYQRIRAAIKTAAIKTAGAKR